MLIAGLFPGQGSQAVGMLADLATEYPIVMETFQQASTVLGYDLWQLVQQGSDEALGQTTVTQPAMLSAGVAVWRVWRQVGGAMPVALAGHSLGEYSALVAADCLEFEAAMRLVAERARLMQAAVPVGEGAMAAILGTEDAEVVAACAEASHAGVVEAVNFNSPGQVVIAGNKLAVAEALRIAAQKGAKKSVLLPVSVPSHCKLMLPAAHELALQLTIAPWQTPQIPVVHNVDAKARTELMGIQVALAEQLHRPVLWVDSVQTLRTEYQADVLLEFGPGKVLTGLNRRIERRMNAAAIYDNASLEAALELCKE